MIRQLDHLYEPPVSRLARQHQPTGRQSLLVPRIEFISMPMPLSDFMSAKDSLSHRTLLQQTLVRTQPHRSAHLLYSDQVTQLENNRMWRLVVEFRRVRALQPANVP